VAAIDLAVSELPVQGRLLRRRDGRLSRPRLEELERSGRPADSGELLVVLVWLIAGEVPIDESDLNAARRRAMFVLASGGDPHRELDIDSVAAERLASELDTPERRVALADALAGLAERAEGLTVVSEALSKLRGEPELAWRSLALALLADELAEE
jgi:hypothetical protein